MRYLSILLAVFLLAGCKKEPKEEEQQKDEALAFTEAHYNKKTSMPCKEDCTSAEINIPVAEGPSVIGDTINKKVFSTIRNIVYFGEKPTNGKTYDEIMESFITSYDTLVKKFPNEGLVPWEAKIDAKVVYKSKDLLNIEVNNYMFTGGAHGYQGNLSLLFDLTKGISLEPQDLFTNVASFTAVAEAKFREKFKVPANKNINSTGFFFEEDKFALPKNIFFTNKGLLLYYNAYEAASYADGPKELLIPYSIANDYLKIK